MEFESRSMKSSGVKNTSLDYVGGCDIVLIQSRYFTANVASFTVLLLCEPSKSSKHRINHSNSFISRSAPLHNPLDAKDLKMRRLNLRTQELIDSS